MLKRIDFSHLSLLLFGPAATGCAAQRAGLSSIGYAIQVGAFSEVKNAERFTDQLQAKGDRSLLFQQGKRCLCRPLRRLPQQGQGPDSGAESW